MINEGNQQKGESRIDPAFAIWQLNMGFLFRLSPQSVAIITLVALITAYTPLPSKGVDLSGFLGNDRDNLNASRKFNCNFRIERTMLTFFTSPLRTFEHLFS